MKKCSKCHVTKELDLFSKKSCSKDGYRSCCKDCDKLYALRNKDRINAYNRGRKDSRREKYWENVEKSRKYKRDYVIANRLRITETNRQWALNNPEKKNANRMKYNADKRQATPSKLTKEMIADIWKFYSNAKRLSEETCVKHHVDHIIPLNGRTVCGLHVPWNLQILSAQENMKKGNKL